MPFVSVKALEGLFSVEEKQQLIEQITDLVGAVKGDEVRNGTWVTVEEVPSGAWGVGGRILEKKVE